MALVWVFSCGELVKTARGRLFAIEVVFRFLRHGMDGVGDVLPCRADGVCGSSCLPLSVRASPAPWGGGLCEVCERRSCLRGGGRGAVEVLPVSLLVVVSSHHLRRHRPSACFVAPVVIFLVPHVCRPLPSPPHVLRFRPLCPSCVCSSPVFSCGFLSLFSPFLRRAGRGVLCLLAYFVAALVPSSRFPHSLRSSPCLLALRVIVLRRPRFRSRRRRRLCSCLVAVLISFVSPRLSTIVGGERGGSLFACLSRRSRLRFSSSCGAAWLLACPGMAAGDVVSAAGCVRFAVSLFVYINWVPARVSDWCRKKAIEKGFRR